MIGRNDFTIKKNLVEVILYLFNESFISEILSRFYKTYFIKVYCQNYTAYLDLTEIERINQLNKLDVYPPRLKELITKKEKAETI